MSHEQALPRNRIVFALALCVWMFPVVSRAGDRPDLAAKLSSCDLPGLEGPVFCGRYRVPEDRTRPKGRQIALNVVVLPATTDSLARDALTFLAGGGVVPATRYAPFLARAFPELRRHRDILLVDQRGTWNSNPLACGDSGARVPPDDPCDSSDVASCLAKLSAHADLRKYGTSAAVADLEEVRGWLGYEQLDLYGASYGTKVAQVYLRLHAERVRCAVLHGVVPLDRPIELDYARSAQSVLERVIQRCASDTACRRAFPGFAAELDSLFTRSPVTVRDSAAGGVRSTVITHRMLRDFTQDALSSARGIERLPWLVHRSWSGDSRPLARALSRAGGPPLAPRGVFLSILCSESIPLVRPEQIGPKTSGTFFGDYSIRKQLCDCAGWPRAPLLSSLTAAALPRAPVLILTGELDPITPPSYGEAVARELGKAHHVVLPARSHADIDPCVGRLIQSFVQNRSMAPADTSCLGASRLRFVTDVGGE